MMIFEIFFLRVGGIKAGFVSSMFYCTNKALFYFVSDTPLVMNSVLIIKINKTMPWLYETLYSNIIK